MITVTRSRVTHATAFLLGASVAGTLFLLRAAHHRDDCLPNHGRGVGGFGSQLARPSPSDGGDKKFAFPSPEERLRYYMGDWHGRTLRPGDVPCREIAAANEVLSDVPVLWSEGEMKRAINENRGRDWLVDAYLRNAYEVIKSDESKTASFFGGADNNDRLLVLHVGDTHSRSKKLPAVAKTRFSKYARSRKSAAGKRFFNTIIFPLEMPRHYEPIDEYIRLHKEGRVAKWKDKKDSLIWRGGVTGVKDGLDKSVLATYVDGGPRIQVVKEYFNKDVATADIAFKKNDEALDWTPVEHQKVAMLARESHTSMEDQLKFKYILNLEGNDVATGLKWQLASNSVVFMAKPTTVSFLMEDLLVPYVHYVPLRDDYSDILDMVRWARENDEECARISRRATLYMRRLWTSDEAKRDNAEVRRGLGEAYRRQFGEAVRSCLPEVGGGTGQFART